MGAQFLSQILSLIRNVIVARLLVPEDFGIAATFALAMAMFEMISNLSVDRLLVQAEDGDQPIFQATAHSVLIARGLLIAVLLLLFSAPITLAFQIPHARWAFQCLALVPLIRGFMHLDTKRRHRRYAFGSDMASELVPQVIILLCAWPFAYWFRDYSTMLWLIILQAACATAMTHLLRERPYQLRWNSVYAKRISDFGWPLMLNGAVMFFVAQGDRVIVGGKYSMTDLGAYSVATMLVVAVSTAFAKMGGNLFLPLLSEARNNRTNFANLYQVVLSAYCLVSVLMSIFFIVCGTRCVEMLYGSRYSMAGTVIVWIAISQAFNLMKATAIVAAFANADSKAALYCNMAGSLGTVLALIAAIWSLDIIYIPMAVLVGNVFAFGVVTVRLRQMHDLPAKLTITPVSIMVVLTVAASTTRAFVDDNILLEAIVLSTLSGAAMVSFLSIDTVRASVMQLKRGTGELKFMRE